MLALVLIAATAATLASAAGVHVTSPGDDISGGTLREAIVLANLPGSMVTKITLHKSVQLANPLDAYTNTQDLLVVCADDDDDDDGVNGNDDDDDDDDSSDDDDDDWCSVTAAAGTDNVFTAETDANLRFKNIRFIGGNVGLHVVSAASAGQKVELDHVVSTGHQSSGIELDLNGDSATVVARSTRATNNLATGFLVTGDLTGSLNVNVDESRFEGNAGDGLHVEADGVAGDLGVTIKDSACVGQTNGNGALIDHTGGAGATTVSVYDSRFNDNEDVDGLQVVGGTGGLTATIGDCKFNNNEEDGLYIEGEDGEQSVSISNVEASNNRDDGVNLELDGAGSASVEVVRLNADKNVVNGLYVSETAAGDLSVSLDTVSAVRNSDTNIEIIEDESGDVTLTVDGVTANNSQAGEGILVEEKGDGSVELTFSGAATTLNGNTLYGLDVSDENEDGISVNGIGNLKAVGNGNGAILTTEAELNF